MLSTVAYDTSFFASSFRRAMPLPPKTNPSTRAFSQRQIDAMPHLQVRVPVGSTVLRVGILAVGGAR